MFELEELKKKFSGFISKLRAKNQSHLQDPMVRDFKALVSEMSHYVDVRKNATIYRARICSGEEGFVEGRGIINGVFDVNNYEPLSLYNVDINEIFAGFGKNDCGAPKVTACGGGRAGEKGVRRLYVAEKPATAVYECRPTLGNVVSVATMKVVVPFKVLDLVTRNTPFGKADLRQLVMNEFLSVLAVNANPDGYIFTQWFSNLVDEIGIGRGIKYSSVIHKGGINLAVFGLHDVKDPDSDSYFGVNAVGSEIYCIKEIGYKPKQFKPLRGDELGLEEWEPDC